jgi:hypothetical protein
MKRLMFIMNSDVDFLFQVVEIQSQSYIKIILSIRCIIFLNDELLSSMKHRLLNALSRSENTLLSYSIVWETFCNWRKRMFTKTINCMHVSTNVIVRFVINVFFFVWFPIIWFLESVIIHLSGLDINTWIPVFDPELTYVQQLPVFM